MNWEDVEYTIHWKEQEIYAVQEIYNKEMYLHDQLSPTLWIQSVPTNL
jgi:hypothetical protein